jgi:hypothetical protein
MPNDRIEKLLEQIEKLRSEQLKATQGAVFLGLTPKVARECEVRRKLMSTLVDRLALSAICNMTSRPLDRAQAAAIIGTTTRRFLGNC